MARERRPDDWTGDLAHAREAEAKLAAILAEDARIEDFEDHTEDVDRLDYSFVYDGMRVEVDLKEKLNRYSPGVTELWPEVPPQDLFIVDETVYRRVVWQGGGGYLLIHDHPEDRWAIFGPWELTLGPRCRYRRWGRRRGGRFLKGKILLNLAAAAHSSPNLYVTDLLRVIERSRAALDSVDSVATKRVELPEVGADL